MIKNWIELTTSMALLNLEAQRVIGLRLVKLAAWDAAALAEAQMMVTEKVAALAEASATIALGGSPKTVIRRYRTHVRANEKRLSRPATVRKRSR
jgi:ABC-type transport system involved in Fe-S cluster assembly fused permease/ATPase subunit